MTKPQALIVFTGGYSGEAVISRKSAAMVMAQIDRQRFLPVLVHVDPKGWFMENEATGEKTATNLSEILADPRAFIGAFIMVHGTPGEDGKMQGYFDLIGLPYTSCDTATSALTFNKRYTVAVAGFGGIAVAKSLHLISSTQLTPDQILTQVTLPLFVKPNNGGSSFGISKVNTAAELAPALEKAFKEDSQVLVEEFISGREFTIGVFKSKGVTTVLPITEIRTENEFFDFAAKYEGKSEEITPAKITETMFKDLSEAAKQVYTTLNCRGVVRIDFIYDEKAQKAFLLEVNTVPGQSEASIIPQQVRAMGWNLTDFYATIIEDSLASK